MPERYLCKDACDRCGNPVYADEGYHGITQNHYHCEDREREKFEEIVRRIDGIVENTDGETVTVVKKRRKKKVREGEGRIALKCIKLATEAFERETGGKVVKHLIWNQQGQYRGPRWDLAAWGINFKFTLEGSETIWTGNIASWATMTAVSKLTEMKISQTDMAYSYEL